MRMMQIECESANEYKLSNSVNEEFFKNPKELNMENLASYRPTIGDEISVTLWRLIRIGGLYKIFEEETETISYFIGKRIGQMLKVENIDDIKKKLINFKLGVIDFPVLSDSLVQITIAECATCSGVKPPLGKPICQLEVGIFVGALETIYPEKKITASEIKCIGGLGDEACLIECQII